MLKHFLYIALVAIVFISCTKEDIEQQRVPTNNSISETEYDNDFRLIAKTVSKSLVEKEFRKILKKEALNKYTGDYDINFTKFLQKEVYSQKKGKNETIKSILTDNLPQEYKTKSNVSNLIDSLSAKYPHLRILIPIECENWDADNFYPTVVFVPASFQDGVTSEVPGFKYGTKNVEEVMVDALNEPAEVNIVIG